MYDQKLILKASTRTTLSLSFFGPVPQGVLFEGSPAYFGALLGFMLVAFRVFLAPL